VIARSGAPLWLALLACNPEAELLPAEGHIMLHIDTDAWVPSSTAPSPTEQRALFDSLLIEVFLPGEPQPCPTCLHELTLTADVLETGGSLAIASDGAREGVRVRLSMYLAAHRHGAVIDPTVSVQLTALLPRFPEEGGIPVPLFLPTDAVGAPIGTLDAPIEAAVAEPPPSRVRTWPGAQRLGCADAPRPGEVCIPGGAFWMGNLRASENSTDPQETGFRLVTLAPFFIDAREVTVGDLRNGPGDNPMYIALWSGDEGGDDLDDWCSYTLSATGERDSLPMNCIHWAGAVAHCEGRGGTLPSEAQFEYVAGALEWRDFVWGTDIPGCNDANWGRAFGVNSGSSGPKTVCTGFLAPGDIGGPIALPPSPNAAAMEAPRLRDVLLLPTGAVFDLAANLGEWTRDWFQPKDSDCWRVNASNLFRDPVCELPSAVRSFRGGYHTGGASALLAAERHAQLPDTAINELGFRCVRPAVPAVMEAN